MITLNIKKIQIIIKSKNISYCIDITELFLIH